jgi:hypothetical protein
MIRLCWTHCAALCLAAACVLAFSMPAEAQQAIPNAEISALQTQLAEAKASASSARKKLGIRRVIRTSEGLLEKNTAAPNRFEVLGILYDSQQAQIKLDDSTANRKAFLETCRALVQAPDEYAELRLNAELLLTQAELAQRGADQQARADALKPLVQRYLGTSVETKVVRIALTMAIELGDASLIGYLRQVIAEQFPGDQGLINFQRDKLAGQVFGAPFIGQFESSDGKLYRLPMDGMGKTTALYFWSKEDSLDQLKDMAQGWSKVLDNPETNASERYQFISFNLDGLPDAGESILREIGLDWPALHLPDGRENPIYKTYVRNDPKLLTMTPTGYTAMVMSGATRVRPDRGWERNFGSALARSWSKAEYASQMQSLLVGEFLVIDPAGDFDPAAPPEYKAAGAVDSQLAPQLKRSANTVPLEALNAIQACFVKPPQRYTLLSDQVLANYVKAESLCRKTMAQHAEADDLWIVRNRLIVALMGRWKAEGKREYYDAAVQEANAAIKAGYPTGTDIVARFCLVREALRSADADLHRVIQEFVRPNGNEPNTASAHALAALLALEVGDRKLHEYYRRQSLDLYAQTPVLWNVTAFLMDRYHRYWLYHPPFTAGWTYGRRMGYFFAIGTPEDADRSVQLELKTLKGETVRIPEDTGGKWTIIEFRPDTESNPHLQRYGTFINDRPFKDVKLIAAVLDDEATATRQAYAKRLDEQEKRKQGPDIFQTMLVPDGFDNAIVQQLGILIHDNKPNLLLIRPDGTIAAFVSGLTMSSQSGNVMQNVIEHHDEMEVEEALAKDDLEQAKSLAFAHAPVEQVAPPDAPKNWKRKQIGTVHLRARAKVYLAMGEYEAALKDAHEAYLAINSKAGYLSMRTEDLEDIEQLKAEIQARLDAKNATQ